MDRLDQVAVFLEVARRQSFRAAAAALTLSTTATSRAVVNLEGRLGARLLERTTRRVRLTAAGHRYRSQVEPAFEALRDADAEVAEQAQRIEGRIRIGAGVTLCEEQLVQLMPEFLRRYPGIELEFVVSDRQVDLITEGLDCAVRLANLKDSGLVARRVASSSHVLCASRDYLKQHGTPRRITDLATGRYVVDTDQARVWRLRRGPRVVEHQPRARFSVNSGQAVRRAVLQ